MDIKAARTWFKNLDGDMVKIYPEVTTTGAAHEPLPGYPINPVEIYSKNNAYRLIIHLPSRSSDFCGELEVSMKDDEYRGLIITGELKSGLVLGPSGRPVMLNRITQIRRISPQIDYSISFNLPEPVQPPAISFKVWDGGVFEIYLEKAAVGNQN